MIWDVRSEWSQGRSEHVAYEDAESADAAVRQTVRRGIATELGGQRGYRGLLAREATYYVYDGGPNSDFIEIARTFETALAVACRALSPFARYESVAIEIGDDDGPDRRVANVSPDNRPWTQTDVDLDVVELGLVPARFRKDRSGIEELQFGANTYRVMVIAPFASQRAEYAEREQALAQQPLPSMQMIDDLRRSIEPPTAPAAFREQIMRSPITPAEPPPAPSEVISLEEAQRRRYAGLDLGGKTREAPEESGSAASQRMSLLELNGRRRRNPSHVDKDAAVAKYEEFHRFAPKKLGEFASGFTIPKVVYKGGRAKWVTYRSDKIDPSTLKKPRGAVDYIHEHDAGVECYLAKESRHATERCDVPEEFRDVDALTLLGTNLGFCFVTEDGEEIEAISQTPMPELYATPDGKCLLVIQSKRSVIAMEWGGALGVFARGIDG